VVGLRIYEHYAGEHPVLDALYEARLRRLTLEALDRRNRESRSRADVVVTLTTLPSRIDRIAPTIKSLLNQTVCPAAIRLNLPAVSRREQRAYAVPGWLRQLESVTICPCEDLGPATKLVPALADTPPDRRLIVVDDDRIYHRGFIEQLVRLSDAHPDAVVAGSGWEAPPDLVDRPSTLVATLLGRAPVPLRCTRVGRGRAVDVVRGATGYLVKPRFFDLAAIADYAGAPEAAFFVDDVWISAHCRARKLVLPGRRTSFSSMLDARFFRPSSLGLVNCVGVADAARNNTIMLQYFADRWGSAQAGRRAVAARRAGRGKSGAGSPWA
jgi:hypothetical protein